jgi:uncharacterized protein YlxW (UPF0749 family)
MGLLEYLSTHTLDQDYAFVSDRKKARATPPPGRPSRMFGALVLAVFAILVVTAAVQTSRNSASAERDRGELADQVSAARNQLAADQARLAELRAESKNLEGRQLRNDSSARGLLANRELLRVKTGTIPVIGPGVRMVVDDAPGADSARNQVLDTDLQRLVNGVWEAGAEAVALNGERLTNLSTIRLAGGAITVNARSLRRPYVVTAIGNPNTLPARFAETSSGQAWLDLQREVGLQLKITTADSFTLPGAEVSLRFANQETGGAP